MQECIRVNTFTVHSVFCYDSNKTRERAQIENYMHFKLLYCIDVPFYVFAVQSEGRNKLVTFKAERKRLFCKFYVKCSKQDKKKSGKV